MTIREAILDRILAMTGSVKLSYGVFMWDGNEEEFWGNCCNTFDEDRKHYVYAPLMGLTQSYFSFTLPDIRVLDIGGGPTSMLLKCEGLYSGTIVDPLEFPQWTRDRYALMNIDVVKSRGEDFVSCDYDEVWIYNCLQHTDDPEQIIRNAIGSAPVLRIFEWIDLPSYPGHPQALTEDKMNRWIGQPGSTIHLNEQGCNGKAYYGVFNV